MYFPLLQCIPLFNNVQISLVWPSVIKNYTFIPVCHISSLCDPELCCLNFCKDSLRILFTCFLVVVERCLFSILSEEHVASIFRVDTEVICKGGDGGMI